MRTTTNVIACMKQISVRKLEMALFWAAEICLIPGWVCTKSQGCPNPLCRWLPEPYAKGRFALIYIIGILFHTVGYCFLFLIGTYWSFVILAKVRQTRCHPDLVWSVRSKCWNLYSAKRQIHTEGQKQISQCQIESLCIVGWGTWLLADTKVLLRMFVLIYC